VAAILAARAPDRPIAVVSAVEGVTTMLDRVARAAADGRDELGAVRVRHRSVISQLQLDPELLNRHFTELAAVLASIRGRGQLTVEERDHVWSFGERASARIVAAHLNALGVRAVPIDAYDLGLVTDSNHGRARVLPTSAERIRSALARFDGIPVITGFVAQDAGGRLTTLGRNGSDLSASLIAEAVRASEVLFWKEVGGVMTADPKLVPQARVLRALSYSEASELTFHGAAVLHAEAVGPLAAAQIPGRVVCVRQPDDAGTLVSQCGAHAGPVGIACRRGIVLARLWGPHGTVELLARARSMLERAGIEPLHMSESEGELVLAAPWSDELGRVLLSLGLRVNLERELATLAAVGASDVEGLSAMLRARGFDVRASWRAGERTSAVFALPEAQLAAAASLAHDVVCSQGLLEGGLR
jgi:aspartate kinase